MSSGHSAMCLTIQKRKTTKQEVFLMAEIVWPSLACPIHSKSQAAASGQRAILNKYMPSSNLCQAGNLPSSASCSASVKQPELLVGSHVSSPPGCGQLFAVFDFRAVHPNLLREASKAKIISGFGPLAPHLASCCLVT